MTKLTKSQVKAVIKLLQRVDTYRLIKKLGLNNFSTSSIQGVMERIKVKSFEVAFYETVMSEDKFFKLRVIKDLEKFKR